MRCKLCALHILAGSGVDPDLVAGVDEEGHLDLSAGLYGRGLGSVGSGIALDAGLGVGNFKNYEVRRLYAENLALIGKDLSDFVFLNELEVVGKLARAYRYHIVCLGNSPEKHSLKVLFTAFE